MVIIFPVATKQSGAYLIAGAKAEKCAALCQQRLKCKTRSFIGEKTCKQLAQ